MVFCGKTPSGLNLPSHRRQYSDVIRSKLQQVQIFTTWTRSATSTESNHSDLPRIQNVRKTSGHTAFFPIAATLEMLFSNTTIFKWGIGRYLSILPLTLPSTFYFIHISRLNHRNRLNSDFLLRLFSGSLSCVKLSIKTLLKIPLPV